MDKTHQKTWWVEVGCRAYKEDGDMRATGTTGGAAGRRPSLTSPAGRRGAVVGRARVGSSTPAAEGSHGGS
jgi:hypothetical protein